MRKPIAFFLLFTCCSFYGFSRKSPLLFAEKTNMLVQLLETGKQRFCITQNAVYSITKKGLEKKAALPFLCTDAIVYKGNIALATDAGLQLFDTKNNALTALLPQKINGAINHLQADAGNHIWFTKEFEGCYMIDDSNEVLQKIKVPVTYSLAYTNDNTIWVGTNVGLYKVPASGSAIERYAEEGIASNDLPDNLVERLYTGAKTNLWVVMPGHVSYIAADNNDEFPDYEFIGDKNNELYHIAAINGFTQAYLFATSQGILLMHNITAGEKLHSGEIHQTVSEKAYLLTNATIEKPEALKTATVKMITTCGTAIYFVTDKGLWSVDKVKLNQRLKKQFPFLQKTL